MCICLGSIVMRSHPNNALTTRWTICKRTPCKLSWNLFYFKFAPTHFCGIIFLIFSLFFNNFRFKFFKLFFCWMCGIYCDSYERQWQFHGDRWNATIFHKPFDRYSKCCMPIHLYYPHQKPTDTHKWTSAHIWKEKKYAIQFEGTKKKKLSSFEPNICNARHC